MTPHFIELHQQGRPVSICLEHLAGFTDKEGITLLQIAGEPHAGYVDESYDEVKALIRDAGAMISKADPRLDTSHWISWEDLTRAEMIGEPVWNSNTRKWMLVIDSGSFRDWIELLIDAGGHERWTEHDAQKYPLYRMRKNITWKMTP